MEMIRLDTLAADRFGVSVEEAAALIMEGRVYWRDQPADKPGMSLPADAKLTLKEKTRRYASRSGEKLEKALRVFGEDPTGRRVCDIGASNGGFTDCLLQHGADHVCAVDVAYGILAWELRQSDKVTVLERTNARHLTAEQVGGLCDMATADVSFISLTKIFPAIDRVLKPDGVCICLIKPQFEAPKNALGKNGIVKDPAILPGLMQTIADSAAENHLYLLDMTVSPIHGTNGNVEYLMHFRRNPTLNTAQQTAAIEKALSDRPDDE
ncbi:MAG: TlyA family RNA methyltransferase [Clostridia bacterium]|nr:TlyA family RNA methyltransferase [Clostridia bacterium]